MVFVCKQNRYIYIYSVQGCPKTLRLYSKYVYVFMRQRTHISKTLTFVKLSSLCCGPELKWMFEVICGLFGGGCIHDNDKGLSTSPFSSSFAFSCEINRANCIKQISAIFFSLKLLVGQNIRCHTAFSLILISFNLLKTFTIYFKEDNRISFHDWVENSKIHVHTNLEFLCILTASVHEENSTMALPPFFFDIMRLRIFPY